MEFQPPLIALLDPDGTEMLIAWRRALILFGGFPNDRVVGDDGGIVGDGDDFDVVGREFEQAGIAQLVDGFLLFVQRAINSH